MPSITPLPETTETLAPLTEATETLTVAAEGVESLTVLAEGAEVIVVLPEDSFTTHSGFFPGTSLYSSPYPFPSSTSYPGTTISSGMTLTPLQED